MRLIVIIAIRMAGFDKVVLGGEFRGILVNSMKAA
jgi:hypothetical protein